MGAEHLRKLITRIRWSVILWTVFSGFTLIGMFAAIEILFPGSNNLKFLFLALVWLALSLTLGWFMASALTSPLRFLSEAILHISPSEHAVARPQIEKLLLGRELVTILTRQVYDLASGSSQSGQASHWEAMLGQIPLPLVGLNSNSDIVYANSVAEKYSAQETGLINKNIFSSFEMSFADQADSLDSWLQTCRTSSVTAQSSWERVRLRVPGQTEPRYFDLIASYSQHHSSGAEVMLAFFDHTASYSKEDESISFISLAVHELRTPLTILRGYIEAMGEELDGKLTPETTIFMQRMEASAQSLSAFVSNILNVAHVEQDQLTLQLREENWASLLETIVTDMRLRAQVQGIRIDLQMAPDLPTVAADRVSIAEVVNNLLDNAIKYSAGKGDVVVVRSGLNSDGMIETTIQDFGVGIPTAVMPSLFEKFARNHRNRGSVPGTGLGLYLSKALVGAHKGSLWVRTHEGEGSVFGFTLLAYTRLAEEAKSSDNNSITAHPHGWIKNHSMYRQ